MGLHGAKHMGVFMYVPCDNSQGPGTWSTQQQTEQQQGEQANNNSNSNNSSSKVQLWRNLQKTNVSHTQRWPKGQARHLKRTCLCVSVCCVFSGLAMFFTFRLLWRNKLSATHTHKRRHLYKLHIRHVGRSTNQSQPSRLANFRDTHRRTDTRTLVTVALLNFQTHAKLNPRMCLTFALFWLSGPWVFSLMSLCLFHAECAAPHVRECVWVCTRDFSCVSVSLCVSLQRSFLLLLSFVTSF